MKNGPRKRAKDTLLAEEKAIGTLHKVLNSDFDEAINVLRSGGKIIVTGIGKSGFIGMKIAATLTSLGRKAIFLHPVEAIHGDLGAVTSGDVVLAISFSGESPEIVKLVKYLRRDFDVRVVSITKGKRSSLAKLSDITLEIGVKEEGSPHGIAPMASTTVTLVLGDMIASALTQPKTFRQVHFARLHPGGGLALNLQKVKDFMTTGGGIPLVSETKKFPDALQAMSKKFLGITGVINKKGELVGVITDGDVRRILLSRRYDPNLMISKFMTRRPKSIGGDSNLKAALELMEKFRITSLFVLNNKKKPVGIIHIHDIVEGNIVS